MNRATDFGRGAILITGVSSGLGLGMTRKFLAEGYRVFGSVRSETRARELASDLGKNFTPLIFDVCDDAQVEQAANRVGAMLPDGHLAGLINNAGSAEIGPLLHVSPNVLTQHLDTLVVGQLRVIQRFFRFLVTPPGPPGRIINISSISGRRANPFFGCYSAAKHALEGLSSTLREEIRQTGVAVIVVAPSNIATDIWPKQRQAIVDRYKNTPFYAALCDRLAWISKHALKHAMSVEDVSRVVCEIMDTREPAERYTIDWKRSGWGPFSRRVVTAIAD